MPSQTYNVTVDEYGNRSWYLNGELHRTDGPAIEYANGSRLWYLNGKLHRTDGPAFEGSNGDRYWYLNGELHRTDGPAIERADGTRSWYPNGEYLTEQEWKEQVNSSTCEGKVVEIDGIKYKLTAV